MAQAPDTGGEIADHCIYFIGGQGLQRRADIWHGDQVEIGMMGAQQLMGGVVFHHGNLQAVEVFQGARFGAALMGQDNDGEVQVRPGERHIALAFRRGHDARQQVELVVAGLLQHCTPVCRLDQFDAHAEAILDQAHVIGRQALVAAIFVTVFKGWP